ncbi:carbohydrate ABC transporter permease [Chitinilyticum piscinae]|uniref:Sugar ABC transporter permease n=1 Tax=Chitinilyticum piscinae TaxID=2866724 RepID=A0A8J7FHZ8_9NEIS|nr:sugar ABC transporter permease [Chitinilyticum piscinae]MBE9608565.1 sugar ABC transporter permease [Chitinilyticum piscinae]
MARPGVHASTAWLFMLPFLLLFALFTLWPLLFNGWLAFHDYFIASGATAWNGLANFVFLAEDEQYFHPALLHTLVFLLVVPVLQLVALGMALLLRVNRPGIGMFRALFYSPVILSVTIGAVVWQQLLQPDGLVNWLLASLAGLPQHTLPDWLNDPRYALAATLVFYCWKYAGYYMVLYLAGLQNVPRAQLEAAMLDGAGAWARLRHITLPALQPVILLATLLATIAALKAFQEIVVLTGGGAGTSTLLVYAYYVGFYGQNFGAAGAVAFLLTLFCLLLARVQLRWLGENGLLRHGGVR